MAGAQQGRWEKGVAAARVAGLPLAVILIDSVNLNHVRSSASMRQAVHLLLSLPRCQLAYSVANRAHEPTADRARRAGLFKYLLVLASRS